MSLIRSSAFTLARGPFGYGGYGVAAKKLLNLDALIPRSELDIRSEGAARHSGGGGIPISELILGKLHYSLLRKPDFQRETNDWDIDNVVTLIKSVRDAHLIPALIMWSSAAGYNFVIDGAHRLSALIAWVNDDYGDREISRKFFNHKIPKQQEDNSKECRARIAQEVGTYSDLSKALSDPNPSAERIKWASNIASTLSTQWVTGNAENAEKSFITINQRAVQIDETEKYMINSRRKPNVITARALIRCATGHQYWGDFPDPTRVEISKKAQSIYNILFEPETADVMKTIEMPIAGKSYSAESLRLTLDLIDFANDLRTRKDLEDLEDDKDGESTKRFLDRTFGVVKYISGEGQASLGLHSAVYFWGSSGKHQPSAFLATVGFIQHLISSDRLINFCYHRARFEDFLVTRNSIVKYILGRFGGWKKSAPSVLEMYKLILSGLESEKSDDEIQTMLVSDHRFSGLSDALTLEGYPNSKATRETKIAVRRKQLLAAALRCSICHARLPSASMSDDHEVRVQDGGRGTEANMKLAHPYCNHGFKEHLIAKGKPFPKDPLTSS